MFRLNRKIKQKINRGKKSKKILFFEKCVQNLCLKFDRISMSSQTYKFEAKLILKFISLSKCLLNICY